MTSDATSPLIYLGPPGAGLGFRMSGIAVREYEQADRLLADIRQLKEAGEHHVIFIDEGLAENILADLERLNEDALPAIVLLPNPLEPRNVASEKMHNLIVRAVGSDIIS